MIRISENTTGILIEGCKILGEFQTRFDAGRYLREHPDKFPKDAIAWEKNGTGRVWFATMPEVAKWLLVAALLAVAPARADSLDIEWPNGKHETYDCGTVMRFEDGFVEFGSFVPARWSTNYDTVMHDGFDAGVVLFNIGYPGGHWSDSYTCEVLSGPGDVRVKCW